MTAQSLDPVYPDLKMLNRLSQEFYYVATLGNDVSHAATARPPISITIHTGAASERTVDAEVQIRAATKAGIEEVPMVLELLASARMAARRGDCRRALIDAGTAVEGALTQLLELPSDHRKTLGCLVDDAENKGFTMPADTKTALVHPRNDAVHRGLSPSGKAPLRSLAVAEEIISLVESNLIPFDSLQAVHRPQRRNIVLITSPPG